MPIEKPPKNQNYKPDGGTPYKVKTNDDWGSVAKAHGIAENWLVYFNCGTTDPAEVNWFLRHKVGCLRPTHDQMNWMFTSEARPGLIYVPPPWKRPSFPQAGSALHTPHVGPKVPMNAWFGVGGKAGTMFVVAGIETMTGYVASLDDLGKGMAVAASINRLGAGWGATFGACFIFITGVSNPQRLNGWQQGDQDFNLSLGGNWGKMAQATSKVEKLRPLIDVVSKIGAKTPSGLKSVLKAKPDKWVELIKAGKTVKDFLGIDPNGEPNVFVFDIPLAGGGVEASWFFGVSNFNAVWDHTE
jgi:hypothetical protein